MRDLYVELLRVVSESYPRYAERPLCLFAGRVGEHYDGELLIVGRAVNGWSNKFVPEEVLDRSDQERLVDEATAKGDECPLAWVCYMAKEQTDTEGKRLYNTRRSAFWRVAGRVAREPKGPQMTGIWSSHIAWTNLYKVAPAHEKNPSGRLRRIQASICQDLLVQEVHDLQPRRILFLTGSDWFAPFSDPLGFQEHPQGRTRYAQRTGRLTGTPDTRVVVAPHPQGKPEGPLVEEIMDAFAAMG